jgi:hypothetical protein
MIGHDGFDHFGDDDFNYDDDLSLDLRIPPEYVMLTPEAGRSGLVGQAVIVDNYDTVAASGLSTARQKSDQQLDLLPASCGPPAALIKPATLWWTPVARLIMSPTRYREEWLRHISDMNYERHEYLKRGDAWGARWAVFRAHYYSLPVSWLLIPTRFIFHLLRHWLGF